MAGKVALLCAGGTGGHVFPAEALAHALKARGWSVHLATDERAERFAGKFPADAIHVVPSATLGSKNPIAVLKTGWKLLSGYFVAAKLVRALKPSVVIGFGGYPTLPPLLAASRAGVPTMIHEQNAVMGRANAVLASRVNAIAGGFLPESGAVFPDKTMLTGNPVRPAVLDAAKVPYGLSDSGPFNLLVFGGSQGAQYFSESIPEAIALLPDALKRRLQVTQQARPDDELKVRATYERLGIAADVLPFFNDMAARIARAHFVISRSGASTVSELAAIGRPSLLVPYPFALDHDQAANAAALAAAGGAMVVKQADLTPRKIADMIVSIADDPKQAAGVAAAAKATAMIHASQLLAGLAEAIASGKSVSQFKKDTRA
jgi:UDP-N-acetylglucosamine--N-acetylmuramyl-(pentapeptide) pyrophosphoryl-undecaprenol N-acetylglucosamine transferase